MHQVSIRLVNINYLLEIKDYFKIIHSAENEKAGKPDPAVFLTTAKLLKIDGKSYVMKKNTSVQKIGLLAQDVLAVFPELVKEANNEDGTLSVNYQGLIPVLINAIKEQQAEINELKKMIKKSE